jgi:hypothetical protein
MACDVTLAVKVGQVDWVDIHQIAHITDASGLLGNGPHGGDLIPFAWEDGADWQPGPRQPYTFDVPVAMKGDTEQTRLGNLRALQQLEGQTVGLRRIVDTGHETVTEYCLAVVVNAVTVRWDLRTRKFLRATLIVQVLQPWGLVEVSP